MPKVQSETLEDSNCYPQSFYNTETEIEMCVFYAKILKQLYKNSGLQYSEIRVSLKNIRIYKTVSYEEECDRLSYIFAYGVIHSVIMYDRFSKVLKSNQLMMKKIISMKKIRICILGGGPAFEAASICKLFSNLLVGCGDKGCEPLQVQVVVIDICADWEKEAGIIIDAVQKDLCDPSNIEIHFSFIQADLATDFQPEVRKAIKKAHIVTMVNFLSDVSSASYSTLEIPGMTQNIVESMSVHACLFFLDASGGGVFNKMDRMIDGHKATARIYGPCAHTSHILSIDCVENLSDSLRPIFRYLKSTSRAKISCSTWLKVRNVIKINKLFCNTTNVPAEVLYDSDKLKKKDPKVKIKKIVQSAVKFRELYESDRETIEEDL